MPNIDHERELNTVLAALHYWQRGGARGASERIEAIASNGGKCEPLTAAEIDALCERINVSDTPPAIVIEIFGGLVQTVTIDGREVSADIRDYDTDGAFRPDELERDDDGEEYVLRHC